MLNARMLSPLPTSLYTFCELCLCTVTCLEPPPKPLVPPAILEFKEDYRVEGPLESSNIWLTMRFCASRCYC